MTPQRGDAGSRRAAILDAALRVFGQYGYRRTSIDDIAREAGVGKGTIYLSFASKDEIFQALSQRLSDRMLADAEAARRRPGTTADKLAGMSAAWFGTYADTVRHSPHAADLMDAKDRLSADVISAAMGRYKRLVADVVADAVAAGEFDLAPAGLTADGAAELLIAAARGLESSTASPAAFRRYLDAMVRVMAAGLSPADAAGPG